ncbi:glucosamine-6-phosphate deaminase [Desmospora activa DSM 45169]|uniref:Glucosamine-6-phosphate deaminase n=2 Tax=Desmospora TaxID=500614 RepID=A0A2T4Z6Y5_9BACL|nr:glucosamine-6-phosphate deaminase [Desmospora activa DSM 45169]
MRVIQVPNAQEMNRWAAAHIIQLVQTQPPSVLGFATGSTPEGIYRELVADHRQNGTSYKEVVTFNLDEYVGLKRDHPNSYHTYMQTRLFDHLDCVSHRTHIPAGDATDLAAECHRYEQQISRYGGIDLQLLGIGRNGHIGFNEPGTSFDSRTHVVKLTESTRNANAHFFQRKEEIPTHAITMGIASILSSRQILLLAAGHTKAEAIARLIEGPVDADFPASALKQHSDVTVLADESACQHLAKKGKIFDVG